MLRYGIVLLTFILSLSAIELPAKEKFDLYLLIGQSNMAGRGELTPSDKKPVIC